MRERTCLLLLLSCLFTPLAWSDDWPQWRGENRDGVIDGEALPETFPAKTLPRRWRVEIGAGYSAPSVADGRVYVTDRGPADAEKEIERVLCFDAESGDLIWEHTYDAPYTISYRAGPRAAVTVEGNRALSVGAMGQMKCFDAETGDVIWERSLEKEYDVRMPIWGITAAPLVYQDLVIQIVGGSDGACVVAFDLATGKQRWQAIDERAGYSAPVLIRQGDQDVVVCWTGESVTGLDPMKGNVFWRIEMLPRRMPIGVATPVVNPPHLLVSSFYDGSLLIKFDPQRPDAETVWRRVGIDEKNTDALHAMISTPIIKGDYIYGVDSYGQLRCLELATGDRVWEDKTAVREARWATIHIMRAGDRELMLNDQGHLILAKLTPEGFQEQSRTMLIEPTRQQLNRRDGVVWAHPAIADGFIYARSDEELICAPLSGELP